MSDNKGSNFDDFLEKEGILDECTATAKARAAEMEANDPVAHTEGGILTWIADMQFDEEALLYRHHAQPLRRLSDEDVMKLIISRFPLEFVGVSKNFAATIQDAIEKLNNGDTHEG